MVGQAAPMLILLLFVAAVIVALGYLVVLGPLMSAIRALAL